MKIEVRYNNNTYGTGENAKQYKVTISQNRHPSGLSVRIDILSLVWGQTDTGDSAALVRGGEIFLPSPQATALATAILCYLEQSKNATAPPPVEIMIDEDALESICVPSIKVSDLARKLSLKSELIIEDAQKQGLQITDQAHYLSLRDAEKIYERLKQKS